MKLNHEDVEIILVKLNGGLITDDQEKYFENNLKPKLKAIAVHGQTFSVKMEFELYRLVEWLLVLKECESFGLGVISEMTGLGIYELKQLEKKHKEITEKRIKYIRDILNNRNWSECEYCNNSKDLCTCET